MRLTKIEASDFLCFDHLDLQVGPGLTVVTGPNGIGKTNLGRCVDLARAALAPFGASAGQDRLELYRAAGRDGSPSFRVALGMTLDQPRERDLVLAFVRAAFASGQVSDLQEKVAFETTPANLDRAARSLLAEDSLAPLYSGTLHVRHDQAWRDPWFAAWEFQHDGRTWHIGLTGTGQDTVRAGAADPAMTPSGNVLTLTQRMINYTSGRISLPETAPADDPLARRMDFCTVLPEPGEAMGFAVAPADMSNPLAASARGLAAELGIEDPTRRHIQFKDVMWEVLHRGMILTDNRRIPFERRFAPADASRPMDLRDGRNIPAELYRLKNGDAAQRRRYAEIEGMFDRLAGRELGLRSRHVPAEDLVTIAIEPTVVGHRGERPIEFCGAAVQEALVLSTLLPGEPGRLLVLDEPAANLEPVMQHRLASVLRQAGQCLVITHSADLVPIDQPSDLDNIVRLAPGAEGPRIRRARTLDRRAWSKWATLLEPSHVRALLFAARVILCEGPTEVGALRRWWADTAALGLPTPEEAHIPIINVGGDSGFGAYIAYLDAFGVPWAVVADGPALRPTSKLAKQLRDRGHLTAAEPDPAADLEHLVPYWRSVGVFTVATDFGDDGNKAGEFEALLRRVDAQLLERVQAEIGKGRKPRVGALFAAEHPNPPDEVLTLYRSIMEWFGSPRRSQ